MKPRSQKSRVAPDRPPFEEESDEPLPDHSLVKSAAVLDDYLDQEVVDRSGRPLGTLSCYWEGQDGELVFCGIQANGGNEVRVVPGDGAQVSERHSWVRLNYSASVVLKAPQYTCEQELDGAFEQTIYSHYGIQHGQPHSRLRYAGSHSEH